MLIFFALIFLIISGKIEQRFTAVITGLLFFPHIIAFRNSPYIAPQTLLLIIPLCVEFWKEPSKFIQAIKKFPLKYPLLIFAVMCCITALYTSGEKIKNMYDMFRYVFDTYMFFVLAYWYGINISAEKLLKFIFIPISIFCAFGIIEFALEANYPYKFICSSFPVYQGLYNLNSSVSLGQDWRSRLCITTHHPNTLTPMLLSMIFLMVPLIKKMEIFKFKFLFIFLCVIVVLAGSRTGALCLGGLLLLYLTRKLPVIIKITLLFFGAVFIFYEIANIIAHFDIGQGSSLSLRENQLLYTITLFLQSPITGNGTGYMAESIFEVDAYGDKTVDSSIGALESFLFRILIDFGAIGLLAQLIIIGFLLFYFFRRRKKYFAALQGMYITAAIYAFVFLAGDSVGTFRFTFTIIGFCIGNCFAADQKESAIPKEELYLPDYLEDYLESVSKDESKRSDE